MPTSRNRGLTANALKLIAMLTMTIDHIGMELLPQYPVLRLIGRLAMPIYAFMIAEGCRHTRSMKNYLLRLSSLALVCQVVYFFALGSLYQCILVTFSLSAGLIWLYGCGKRTGRWLPLVLSLAAVFFLCEVLPQLLRRTDFGVDYGFFGVILPLLISTATGKSQRLRMAALGLILLGLVYGGVQWYALAAVPLLALYSGEKGTLPLGKLFYLYYPLHLAAIHGIGLLLK